jgi:hypothetical protein
LRFFDMPVSSLARQAGLKIGPVVLETLLRRFFDRVTVHSGEEITKLRQDEVLYDATFNIIKVRRQSSRVLCQHNLTSLAEVVLRGGF